MFNKDRPHYGDSLSVVVMFLNIEFIHLLCECLKGSSRQNMHRHAVRNLASLQLPPYRFRGIIIIIIIINQVY